jgi:poly(3-hydroxybutyrate) depolymerase
MGRFSESYVFKPNPRRIKIRYTSLVKLDRRTLVNKLRPISLSFFCSMIFSVNLVYAESLPKLNLAPQITVSGLSSGGYMANQFHLAYAEKINGVGIIAAGPYYCSEDSLLVAQAQCLNKETSAPPIKELLAVAKQRAAEKKLADLSVLQENKVWLFHGTKDDTVARPVTDGLADFYKALVNANNIAYVTDIPAGHGFPTLNSGVECGAHTTPFINNCNYDAAGKMLTHFFGELTTPATSVTDPQKFDQTTYNVPQSGLLDEGYIYIPQACAAGELCKLHVSFHGCQQSAKIIDKQYVTNTGYNAWAETNNIVVLYPQVDVSLINNPKACWDWWGYTGENFAERDGKQIQSVWNMVNALYK